MPVERRTRGRCDPKATRVAHAAIPTCEAGRWLVALSALAWLGCSEGPMNDGSTGSQVGPSNAAANAPPQGTPPRDPGSANPSAGFDNPDPGVTMSTIEVTDNGTTFTEECARETQTAMQVDVDMYIMLDRSSSMRLETGGGQSKWDAIRGAIATFVQDPQSEGLGVGLQYFPLGVPGAPESCVADAECGPEAGPCGNRACLPDPSDETFPLIPCQVNDQCPLESPGCAPFALCEGDETLACSDFAAGCGPFGACLPVSGECIRFATCDPMAYARPAVGIDVLPANGQPIVDSLMAANPTGLTPTGVALLGALNHARSRALDNPAHRVLAVLATDGLPTDCVTEDVQTVEQAVDAVAREARRGVTLAPSILTYVIGVFGADDPDAQQKLDQIALSGGTSSAFIVDPTGNVSQQFLGALSEIRGGSLACEFQLPTPTEGQTLDTTRVNVELTSARGTQLVAFVGDQAGCSQAELAWYYERAPTAGGDATIKVCEATCSVLQAEENATVQIVVGCPTQGPE